MSQESVALLHHLCQADTILGYNGTSVPVSCGSSEMADGMLNLLVIDDDDDLLQMTARRLRRKNFEVDLAHDIAEANSHFASNPNRYIGIICDLFLGSENGLDFFEEVCKTDFAGEFILATGDDSGDSRIQKFRALPRFSCLQKPFELQTLVDILNRPKQQGG